MRIIMQEWFSGFYEDGGGEALFGPAGTEQQRQRILQRRREGREITADIEFVSQRVTVDENAVPTNTLTYNQNITYEQSVDHPEELIHEDVATLPFNDMTANTDLGMEFRDNIAKLEGVQLPLEVMVIDDNDGSGFLSTAFIVVFVVVAFAILVLLAVLAVRKMKTKPSPDEQEEKTLWRWASSRRGMGARQDSNDGVLEWTG